MVVIMVKVLSRKEFDEKHVFFAFGKEQLNEQLKERGLNLDDVVCLGDGIYFDREGWEYCKVHPLNTLK